MYNTQYLREFVFDGLEQRYERRVSFPAIIVTINGKRSFLRKSKISGPPCYIFYKTVTLDRQWIHITEKRIWLLLTWHCNYTCVCLDMSKYIRIVIVTILGFTDKIFAIQV